MNYGYFLAYATVVTLCHVVPDSNQVTAGKEQNFRGACSQRPLRHSDAQILQAAGNTAHLWAKQGWKMDFPHPHPSFFSL